MPNLKIVYADQWGDIIDREASDCVELRWFDTSSAMGGKDFNAFLTRYADQIEACGRRNALIDAVQFKMDMSRMVPGWRDEHITPRYNAAGLKKFAFIMPEGMPAIGAPPENEGPAKYPTGYFIARVAALSWFNNEAP
jgi:hypothetical protein